MVGGCIGCIFSGHGVLSWVWGKKIVGGCCLGGAPGQTRAALVVWGGVVFMLMKNMKNLKSLLII